MSETVGFSSSVFGPILADYKLHASSVATAAAVGAGLAWYEQEGVATNDRASAVGTFAACGAVAGLAPAALQFAINAAEYARFGPRAVRKGEPFRSGALGTDRSTAAASGSSRFAPDSRFPGPPRRSGGVADPGRSDADGRPLRLNLSALLADSARLHLAASPPAAVEGLLGPAGAAPRLQDPARRADEDLP